MISFSVAKMKGRTDNAEERIGGTETRAPSWNGPLTECTGDVPAEGASSHFSLTNTMVQDFQ